MTTMPVEIFSDHIDDNEETVECNKSLSKMNKSELYQLCKKLVNENHKLQLFVNTSDELHKQNQNIKLDMSKKIKKLEKDIEELKNLRVVRQTKEKIQKFEEKIQELEEDNEDYHFKIKDLEKEIENYEKLAEQSPDLEIGEAIDLHIKQVCEEEFDFDGATNLEDIQENYTQLNEDKDNLEDKIVEQDVEISNLKLQLEEAKSYEKSFNKVKANKDDIEEDLSEEINNLQKEIRELKETHRLVGEDLLENIINLEKENKDLKEKDKKAKEIFKLMGEWYEDNIIGHLPESEEEDEEENE